MIRGLPTETVTALLEGAPSGLLTQGVLGVELREQGSDLVKIGRTTNGIVEKPTLPGYYWWTFVLPAEGGDYYVLWDRDNGARAEGMTAIEQVRVSSFQSAEDAEVGEIAWRARGHIPETYLALWKAESFGPAHIQLKADVIKRRVMTTVVAVADEPSLDTLVLDYLGRLVALELIPPGRDYWANQIQSQSIGDDPTEIATYADRVKALADTQSDLLRQIRRDEPLILPLILDLRLPDAADAGPEIDEDEDYRTTADPREFPAIADFPEVAAGEVVPVGWTRTWERLG